jgi:hypothetical protein
VMVNEVHAWYKSSLHIVDYGKALRRRMADSRGETRSWKHVAISGVQRLLLKIPLKY